jgi:sigma-B regulation protein RsbU (phosphoserine phosphatase)
VDGYDKHEAWRYKVRPGAGIVGVAAQSREVVFVPDVAKDARYVSFFPGVRAELAIPLVHRDKLVGVLNIEGPEVEAFTPEAQTALAVLASHAAVAIENATLYKEAQWYAGLLGTLYEIGKETASILDLDALLTEVAEVVKRVIDYERFGILLLDEAAQALALRKAVGFAAFEERKRIKVTEGLCGAAFGQEPGCGDVDRDPPCGDPRHPLGAGGPLIYTA